MIITVDLDPWQIQRMEISQEQFKIKKKENNNNCHDTWPSMALTKLIFLFPYFMIFIYYSIHFSFYFQDFSNIFQRIDFLYAGVELRLSGRISLKDKRRYNSYNVCLSTWNTFLFFTFCSSFIRQKNHLRR